MISQWQAALLGGSVIIALNGPAFAQIPPAPAAVPPPTIAGQEPLYGPQQLPSQRGVVQQFTLTPRGDIDGLILTDGTEVKTPPHLSTQIAYAIKPGDPVTIHGLHAAALPLVQAVSITDDATARTVIDNGPPGPPRGSAALSTPSGMMEVQGRVRVVLHGPQGDVNGALLEDGTILHLPPRDAYPFASLLQPGQMLVAEGMEVITALGKVMDAKEIGPSREQLSLIEATPGPGPGRRRRPPSPAIGPPGLPRP
jgi:hypothetical protein